MVSFFENSMKKKKYVYIYIYITVFSSLRCLENSVKKKRSLDSKKKKNCDRQPVEATDN